MERIVTEQILGLEQRLAASVFVQASETTIKHILPVH